MTARPHVRLRAPLVALLAVTVAAGTACGPNDQPDVLDTGPRHAPAWSARMPDRFERPLRAQVAGDAVVVESRGGVAVFNRSDGALRWQRYLQTSASEVQTRIAGTALVIDDGDRVRLVDLATGTVRADLPYGGDDTPVATAAGVYVYTHNGVQRRLTAYDTTGAAKWQRDFDGLLRLPLPPSPRYIDPLTAPPDAPVLVTTRGLDERSATVVTLSPDTGAEIRRFAGPSEFTFRGYSGISQISGTFVAWDFDRSDCHVPVVAFDGTTGARRWQAEVAPLDQDRLDRNRRCYTIWDPVIADGKNLIESTPANEPRVRDLRSGAVRWTGPTGSMPLELSDTIVLSRQENGRGDLVAVDITTGAERWRVTGPRREKRGLGGPSPEHAAFAGTFVLTIKEPDDDSSEGRTIIVYDALTGRPRWSSDPGVHLLGAGADGLVAAAYPSSNPLDPGSVEIRYFPPQPG
jgi:outer membrane protein assembly factor BamB